MELKDRLIAFEKLREAILMFPKEKWPEVYFKANNHNTWFDKNSVKKAMEGLLNYLQPSRLLQFADQEKIPVSNLLPKTIGVIMAGNIPLAGLHDYICVLLCGHRLKAKLSSQDPYLLQFVNQLLEEVAPDLAAQVEFSEQLKEVDAIIATGSDNSSRYFDYYFSKYPHIIRKNRTSVAILDGKETTADFEKLADDILLYYGLGCRNISKLLAPEGESFQTLLAALEPAAKAALQNHKYANNYDYNKSIYLVNGEPHLDNGFLMLRESESWVSPVSVVFYQHYHNKEELNNLLLANESQIQCTVSREGWYPNSLPFGKAQYPLISDFADNENTIQFLLQL